MIVCCGEALIDFLPRTSSEGAAVYQPFCGGSIYNTAIALGRLGIDTGLFTGISTDFFGDQLREGLKASKVDLKYIKHSGYPSMLAFVKLEGGQARYSFFNENSASRMLTRKDLPKLAAKVRALHFGSISLIAEPGATSLEALMRRETKTRVICLDPNIRPTVIAGKRAYLARINRMIGLCDILKISDEDVAWMTGKKDLAAAARRWLKAGARIVAVTKGGEGVEAITARLYDQASVGPVEVADTVERRYLHRRCWRRWQRPGGSTRRPWPPSPKTIFATPSPSPPAPPRSPSRAPAPTRPGPMNLTSPDDP
jgi:fructokinase